MGQKSMERCTTCPSAKKTRLSASPRNRHLKHIPSSRLGNIAGKMREEYKKGKVGSCAVQCLLDAIWASHS